MNSILTDRRTAVQKVKQRVKEQWPLLAFLLAINLAHPLEQIASVPLWLTYSMFGLAYVGWFTLYAVRVWRQAAQDKRDLEAKQAAADAQLFGN